MNSICSYIRTYTYVYIGPPRGGPPGSQPPPPGVGMGSRMGGGMGIPQPPPPGRVSGTGMQQPPPPGFGGASTYPPRPSMNDDGSSGGGGFGFFGKLKGFLGIDEQQQQQPGMSGSGNFPGSSGYRRPGGGIPTSPYDSQQQQVSIIFIISYIHIYIIHIYII